MSATIRVASRAAMRPMARPTPALRRLPLQPTQRFNSSSTGQAAQSQGVVLAALAALGIGGYWYLKPVREVAAKLNATLDKAAEVTQSVTDTASAAGKTATKAAKQAVDTASAAAGGDADDSLFAKLSKLAPGVVAAVSGGGLGGLLSNLKGADITSALETLKKSGSDEIDKVVDVVQKKLKEADGKVEKVDWKALASELSKEFGGKYQHTIDMLIGKIPTVDDFNDLAAKLKSEGKDKLKDLEEAASKVYANVEKAAKDKEKAGDAFVAGVKATKDEDLDKLAKALKELASSAGLPADTVIDYARDKAKEGRDYAEQYAKQVQDKFDLAAKWLPVDEESAVKAASDISPSLGKIVKELLDEAKEKVGDLKDKAGDLKDKASDKADELKDKGKDLADKGKKELDKAAKK